RGARRLNTVCHLARSASTSRPRRRAISLSSDSRSGTVGSITTRGMHSSCATTRGAGGGPCTSTEDDTIDPVTVHLLRAQSASQLLAHYPGKEASDRVLLPMGRAHDGGNRHPLRLAQHGEHASLFRPWPVFARGARFGLRLAGLMPRANGLLRCNRSPLAGADDL